MFRPSEFFKNLLQQKEAEQQKKDAEAAQQPSVTVSVGIHPPPLKKPAEERKQLKPSQMLTASDSFSKTVGENLTLELKFYHHGKNCNCLSHWQVMLQALS